MDPRSAEINQSSEMTSAPDSLRSMNEVAAFEMDARPDGEIQLGADDWQCSLQQYTQMRLDPTSLLYSDPNYGKQIPVYRLYRGTQQVPGDLDTLLPHIPEPIMQERRGKMRNMADPTECVGGPNPEGTNVYINFIPIKNGFTVIPVPSWADASLLGKNSTVVLLNPEEFANKPEALAALIKRARVVQSGDDVPVLIELLNQIHDKHIPLDTGDITKMREIYEQEKKAHEEAKNGLLTLDEVDGNTMSLLGKALAVIPDTFEEYLALALSKNIDDAETGRDKAKSYEFLHEHLPSLVPLLGARLDAVAADKLPH